MTTGNIITIIGLSVNFLMTLGIFVIGLLIKMNDLKHLTSAVEKLETETVKNKEELQEIAISVAKQVATCSAVREKSCSSKRVVRKKNK